jgi:ribosomal protein S18 acetylase RimI-like enzyme
MIQRASENDIEFILSKAIDTAMEATQMEISEEKATQMFRGILNKGGYYLVDKDENDSISGWILLGENTDYFTDKKHGFIYDVYVLPQYRGKGISKQLLNEGKTEFKKQGYDEVRLNVFDSNFAKEIYKNLGYKDLNSIMVASI